MGKKTKPIGHWQDYNRCKEEALKYKSRTEFNDNSNGAYDSARKKGWLDEICSHMTPLGNLKKRLIYIYEFPDNHVYVGLTCNIEKRNWEHLNVLKSPVYKHIQKTKLIPTLLKGDYIPVENAQILEAETIQKYKDKNWNILNSKKAGGIGGDLTIWTFEKCKEEALKHNTKVSFKKASYAYVASRINGWLDEVCSHMEELKKPNGYWTYETCKIEALKYKTKIDFRNNCSGAYNIASRYEWFDEICSHMEELVKPVGYWNDFNICKEEALKYKNRSDFNKYSPRAYQISRENNWLDEICSHMEELKKPVGYYNIDICKEEALKYNTRSQFKDNSPAIYSASQRLKCLDEICSHMEEIRKPKKIWSKEECYIESQKYNGRKEFASNNLSAYRCAEKNGWLDEFTKNYKIFKRPESYWTIEICKEEANKYKTRTEFHNENSNVFKICSKNGWLDIFFPKK